MLLRSVAAARKPPSPHRTERHCCEHEDEEGRHDHSPTSDRRRATPGFGPAAMNGSEANKSAEGGAIEITGRTRVLGIFADPIAHVKAPPRINAIAQRRGQDAVMVPFQVDEAHLAQTFDMLRVLKSFGGGIVTVPHKTAAAKLCDRISTRAQGIGATNVIRREPDGTLVGDMLDGLGFVSGLRSRGIEPAGMKACLAGAGGAANAIAFALVEAGVSVLTLSNRTRSRAEELRERILPFHSDADIRIGGKNPAGHDLVVNGTSLGTIRFRLTPPACIPI